LSLLLWQEDEKQMRMQLPTNNNNNNDNSSNSRNRAVKVPAADAKGSTTQEHGGVSSVQKDADGKVVARRHDPIVSKAKRPKDTISSMVTYEVSL